MVPVMVHLPSSCCWWSRCTVSVTCDLTIWMVMSGPLKVISSSRYIGVADDYHISVDMFQCITCRVGYICMALDVLTHKTTPYQRAKYTKSWYRTIGYNLFLYVYMTNACSILVTYDPASDICLNYCSLVLHWQHIWSYTMANQLYAYQITTCAVILSVSWSLRSLWIKYIIYTYTKRRTRLDDIRGSYKTR